MLQVFYGPRSLVFPESDNRKWTIMAMFEYVRRSFPINVVLIAEDGTVCCSGSGISWTETERLRTEVGARAAGMRDGGSYRRQAGRDRSTFGRVASGGACSVNHGVMFAGEGRSRVIRGQVACVGIGAAGRGYVV